jgi:endonuclease/exonuclease/phosphatase family metal-dependent hydrolase
VDRRTGSRPAALPHGLLAARTGMRPLPFAISDTSLGWHGQTVLVTAETRVGDLVRLPLPGLEPRGALIAELGTREGAIRIVAVHLGLVRRYRLLQLAAIREAVTARGAMPTVIIGDYNEWSPRGGLGPLAEGYRVHSPGPSFPAPRPMARLDRIALSPGVHLAAAGVAEGRIARIASDHLPVWAEIRLEPGAA